MMEAFKALLHDASKPLFGTRGKPVLTIILIFKELNIVIVLIRGVAIYRYWQYLKMNSTHNMII